MNINTLFVSFNFNPPVRSKIHAAYPGNRALYRAAEQFDRATIGLKGFIYSPRKLIGFLSGCLYYTSDASSLTDEERTEFIKICMQSACYQQTNQQTRTIEPVAVDQETKDAFLAGVTRLTLTVVARAA